MPEFKTLNRWCAAGLWVMAAAGAGCGGIASSTQPTALSPELAAGSLADTAAVSTAATDSVGPELAIVRQATAAFHDSAAAAAAGYVLTPVCDSSPAGTMGRHAPNPALIADPALDPARPEVLLYLEKPGEGLRLVAVEYMKPVIVRDPDTGNVGPWMSASPWPVNYQVVSPTPQMFGQTFQGPMPGHVPGMPWHWDLHVWIWAHNPSGMFAQWNPALSCN